MSGNKAAKLRWMEKKRREYIEQHGRLPECECGCGETVNLSSRGVPNRFAGPNHQSRVLDMARLSTEGKESRARDRGDIPVEKFRDVVCRLKEQRDMTWAELADMAGVSVKTLRSAVYHPDKKYVTRGWATAFFRRASGEAERPSDAYRRQLQGEQDRYRKAELEIDDQHGVISFAGQKREVKRANDRRLRDAAIARYLEEHGEAPRCACGCGKTVRFTESGKPARFFNSQHQSSRAGRISRGQKVVEL